MKMIKKRFPFKAEWEKAMKNGSKSVTSRTRRYGHPGEHFTAFGCIFKIWAVDKIKLGAVAKYFCSEEGCNRPSEFKEAWIKLHPKAGFKPEQQVYMHRFILMGKAPVCEFCGNDTVPVLTVLTELGHPEVSYMACANCLIPLVTHSLSPEQYLRAKDQGGSVRRFLLHGDFYDELTGEALQPIF